MKLKPGIYYGRAQYQGRRSLKAVLQRASELEQKANEEQELGERLYLLMNPSGRH